MDNPENPTPISSELEELRNQYEELRHLVITGLVFLLIISGALNLYLFRQWKFYKADLSGLSQQATPGINQFMKERPNMDEFVRKLAEYGKTHPDFAPIMGKYGLAAVSHGATAPVSATPPSRAAEAPLTAPSTKK